MVFFLGFMLSCKVDPKNGCNNLWPRKDLRIISPFSCFALLLQLGQGKLGFFIDILSILFDETFLLKELSIVGLGVHLLP